MSAFIRGWVDPVATHAGVTFRQGGVIASAVGSISTVGSTLLVYLDFVAPGGFFTRDGDAIQIYLDVFYTGTANLKTVYTNYGVPPVLALNVGGAYNNTFMRLNTTIVRISSTTGRSSITHSRFGTSGVTETDRTIVTAVDWSVPQTVRVAGNGVANNDITFQTCHFIWQPA
jgi:hypothetical protein